MLVFHAADCRGLIGGFEAPEEQSRIAKYSLSDMVYRGLCNDCVSSVKVPYGYSIKLWAADGFGGDDKVVNGSMFLDDTLSMECSNVFEDFNDVTSSLWVYRNTSLGTANGYW